MFMHLTKMSGLTQVLSHVYTMTMVFFTLLLLELAILVRSVAGSLHKSGHRPITAGHLLELIEEQNPASRYKICNGGLKNINTDEPIEIECAICAVCLCKLEEGEEIRRLRTCNHTFHKVCVDMWLQQDWATCPLCRTVVLPEEIVMRYRQRGEEEEEEEYDGNAHELVFLLSALHGNNVHRLL